MVEREVGVLREWISGEQEKRRVFSKQVHTYLPSSFCPALREQAPDLTLEGTQSDLPDVSDALPNYTPLLSPF